MKITLTSFNRDDLAFTSYNALLRWVANQAQEEYARRPERFYLHKPRGEARQHRHEISREIWGWTILDADYARLYELQKRYQAYCHYMREVEPKWQKVGEVHWGDNSVDEVQQNKYGQKRHKQLTGPSGDACF